MKQSEVQKIIKEEIAKYISEVIAAHVVNESIRKIKTTKHKKSK
jgi:hypothetical protein